MPPSAPASTAAPYVPADHHSLDALRHAAADCRGCALYAAATQTVFGEGPAHAPLMFVGEVPGDQEDLAGKPFVGPAGQLLDRALAEAGVDRGHAYVTNAVKHFSFIERGKRRIHQTPKVTEIRACAPWLEAEIEAVGPRLLVALGATAAKAMLGNDFRITTDRGRVVRGPHGLPTIATAHPSAILRAEPERQAGDFAALVADLRLVAETLAALPATPVAPVAPVAPGETSSREPQTATPEAPFAAPPSAEPSLFDAPGEPSRSEPPVASKRGGRELAEPSLFDPPAEPS